ncbi:site-2 protease family protein [Actinoplanes regularis]|uniref:site-2 protease family protein n=1 Tax=Actinoplanes regularis TaxID=52697 RepID=UPI000B793182|nr:site-2 protease family protein [Actinoplanes regularis]GIE87786.1 peptidase M50 [Actinoplanes regularis]
MEESATRRPPVPPGGRPVGRVLGIPVHANGSMVLLALLVTVVYGNYARAELGLEQPWAYLIGLGFVACLLGSVLLHELGHAVIARRNGIGVRRITLELLSGWTEMERDAPSPRVDALVSLAGPLVSLLLGGVATGAALVLPEDTVPGQIAFQLAVSNVLVAAFNVLPGLPLDGGRALRAAMWALLKDRNRATVMAGWAGRVLAFGAAVVVLALYQLGILTLFGMLFVLLVTLTLWHGAGQSIRLGRMTGRFPLIDLGRLARPLLAVPAGTPLGEAQRRRAEDPRPDVVLAVTDSAGSLTALVDPVAAERVPVDRRPWVSVESVSRSRDGLTSLPVELTGEQVVRELQAHPGAQYLVTAGEDVIGVLRVADVAAVLEPRRAQRT